MSPGRRAAIKISRIDVDKDDYLMNMLSKSIGDSINKEGAFTLIETLYKQKLVNRNIVNILKAATDDSTLAMVEKPYRDNLRAEILKAAIVAALI